MATLASRRRSKWLRQGRNTRQMQGRAPDRRSQRSRGGQGPRLAAPPALRRRWPRARLSACLARSRLPLPLHRRFAAHLSLSFSHSSRPSQTSTMYLRGPRCVDLRARAHSFSPRREPSLTHAFSRRRIFMFLLTQALVGAEVGLSSWSLAEYVLGPPPLHATFATLTSRPLAAATTRSD